MDATDTPPLGISRARSAPAPRRGRLFHTIAALVLIALVLTGFHLFYFQGRAYPGRELTPPIRGLIILHGICMSAWMVVFLAQPLLILKGKRKAHAVIGTIASCFAAAIVVLGIKLGVEAARVKPPGLLVDGLDANQFMAIPVIGILIFGGCVAAAIVWRRRPSLHRALMLLGTLSAIAAALNRIGVLSRLYDGTVWDHIWGPYFTTVVVAFLLLGLKRILSGSWDRIYGIGCLGLAAALAANYQFATTGAWNSVARALLRWLA